MRLCFILVAVLITAVFVTMIVGDELHSEGVAKARPPVMLDAVGNSRLPQVRLAPNEAVAGPLVIPVNIDDVVGYLLKDLLGAEAFTPLESSTVGQHVFTPQAALGLTGLSVEINRDSSISNNVWKASGGHVASLDFTAAPGQVLLCNAAMTFKDLGSGATGQSPTYGTNARYAMTHTGTVLVGALPFNMVNFALKIDAGLMSDRRGLGSKLILQQQPGRYKISGSITAYFDDLALVNAFLNDTAQTISVQFTLDSVGVTPLLIKFVITSSAFLSGETPKVGGPGEVMLTLPFDAVSGTAGNLLSVTLTNQFTSAY